MHLKTTAAAFTLAIAASLGLPAAAETVGVTDTEIKIGNTMPYSGPASAYGVIGKSMTACFNMFNDQGGINGRKINFITLDDGYTPSKTVEVTRRLIEQEEVAALTMTLGTPTNSAIVAYVNQKEVPHLFLATGATKWNSPDIYPWTTGFQPNYSTEAKIYAARILSEYPDAKIAVLYQNDDFGKDYYEPFKAALEAKGKADMIVSAVPYEVTDPTVESQVLKMKDAGADVFVNITTPKFAAIAIRTAADSGWKAQLKEHLVTVVSSSIKAVMEPAGFDKGKDVVSVLWQKDPNDSQWAEEPDMKAYKEFFAKYYQDGNFAEALNVIGYQACIATVETLKKAGDDLSRENIMKAALSFTDGLDIPLTLPGIKMVTGPEDHAPIEAMALARFNGERWEQFGDVIDAASLK